MKRLALITLSALFTLSLLAACGENQRNNVTGPATPSHTDTTTGSGSTTDTTKPNP